MWNDATLSSPLGDFASAFEAASQPGTFLVRERPFLELVSLRGDVRSAEFTATVERACGVAPPAAPNTVARGPTHLAIWLGPDEWLLQSHEPREPALAHTLRAALADHFAAAVDVSSAYAVIELTGSGARVVLQKGCPLDLHPRVFGVGQCAQSHFFKAGVVLRPVEAEGYEMLVRRSLADYAARILLDAVTPY